MVHCRTLIAARFVIAAVAGAGLLAASGPDPVEVLRRAVAKVAATRKTLPNYTCVQTVTRHYFRPAAATLSRACSVVIEERRQPTLDMVLRPQYTDRLRLDVAMIEHREIFSWVGASKFSEGEIDSVVPEGPISTGGFGGFLLSVFSADIADFHFVRSLVADNGRGLMEYAYRVPAAESHYKLKLQRGNLWFYTAYHGTFQVDPATDDVVRLEVDTDELPIATGSCVTLSSIDYATVRIGDSRFMLPSLMRQRWVDPWGNEVENKTVFNSCREYKGESTVTFFPEEGADAAGSPNRPQAPALPVPPDLSFAFTLTTPIAVDTAAAGDTFRGKLTEPLRDSRHRVLAPKGAEVEGRLVEVAAFYRPPRAIIALRPARIAIHGALVALTAERDWRRERTEHRRMPILLPPPGEERTGVFEFKGEHVLVRAGFRSEWRTLPVAER